MRGQRGTLRALVCFPRRPHGLQPRSEVFSEIKKANFNNAQGAPTSCMCPTNKLIKL